MSQLAVALIVAVLLLIGCGNDEAGREASSPDAVAVETGSLSKAQFIEKARAICRARGKQVEAEFSDFQRSNPGAGSEPAAAAERVVETIYLPAFDNQFARILSLGAPPGDEEEVAAILEALQKGLDEAEGHPLRFVRALSAEYKPFAEAEGLAAAYGLPECGKG